MEERTIPSKKLSAWKMQMWLGQMAYEKALYTEALSKFKKSLDLLDSMHIKDERLACNLHNLALCYCALGRHEESDALYWQALEIDKMAETPDKSTLSGDFNDVATHYRNQGKFDRAEPLYQKALSFWDDSETNAEVASIFNNLGLLYCARGDCGVAESFFRRALSIDARVHGQSSRQYASTLVNLAANLCMQGKCEEAEPMFEEGLTRLGYQVGPAPELANALELYLDYLNKSHEDEKAEEVAGRIERIRKKRR